MNFWEVSYSFYKLGVPAMMTSVVFQVLEILNLMFAGHLGNPSVVAGIGLGNMTINLFALSFVTSMNSVIETLGAQAAGNGKIELCGVLLNRGRVMLIYMSVPIFLVLFNMQHFYIYLG